MLLRSGVHTKPGSRRILAARAAWLSLYLSVACSGAGEAPKIPAKPVSSTPAPVVSSPTPTEPAWDHSQAKVPVTQADPIWGQPDAPVTLVTFMDLQCPFCARVTSTLEQLKQRYGAGKIRIVFLHNPLPFHERAYPAALAAAAVRELSGSEAFFKFVDLALSNQADLTDENFVTWAVAAGVDARAFRDAVASQKLTVKVDSDIRLARQVGADGTPAFRINGVALAGAQSLDKFERIIDEQIAEAVRLGLSGTRPQDAYVVLTNRNIEQAPKANDAVDAAEAPEQETVWKIPVASDDPSRGPSRAPVTIVEFCDFECPYCRRVQQTLTQLRRTYQNDVRIVWKDYPLPFHEQAMPAAVLARLVLARRGHAAFFSIHDRMYEDDSELTREKLTALAREYRIAWSDVDAALKDGNARARVDANSDLAAEFHVKSTPYFFVNGVALHGAQPFEAFKTLVDAQLVKARALIAQGVGRDHLYRELTKDGKEPEAPQYKQVPAPAPDRPSLGAPAAPVVIQEWSDFECAFCKRAQPTLRQLQKDFPNQLRIVWRHLPLPFHTQAPVAAEVAEEVLAQKGQGAFWKFHDQVFELQGQPNGLSDANLIEAATALGVDENRLRAALESHRHRPTLDQDGKLAQSIEIRGTPGFVINGYFIGGAQPIGIFRSAIRRALADKKARRGSEGTLRATGGKEGS